MLNRQLLRKLKLPTNFISNLGGPTNMQLVQKGVTWVQYASMQPCSKGRSSGVDHTVHVALQ